MRVKICGTTHLDDALFCDELKVDFLGFIFHPDSPRFVDYSAAREIINVLKYAKAIGVFVHHSRDEIMDIAAQLNLWGVQIYQDHHFESPDFKIIRAHRVSGVEDWGALQSVASDYVLLDAYHEKQFGGTGQPFDWGDLPQDLSRVFLAGGINLSNMHEAKSLNPFAIDLVSGVERTPGRKDFAKLEALMKFCRA